MTNPPPPSNNNDINRKRLSSSGTAPTCASSTMTSDYEENDSFSPSAAAAAARVGTTANRGNHAVAAGSISSACNFYPWSQQQVYDLLRRTFRIQNFRDYQEQIIESTLQGRDAFVIMRTGGGESLVLNIFRRSMLRPCRSKCIDTRHVTSFAFVSHSPTKTYALFLATTTQANPLPTNSLPCSKVESHPSIPIMVADDLSARLPLSFHPFSR